MTLTNLSRVFLLFCCVALASCSTMPSDRTGPENAFSEIRFYCASGGRAGRAQAMFEEAGFTNVSNAGGIEDAREQRQLK